MNLNETILLIEEPNKNLMLLAKKRWNGIAKPLNSLGKLEDIIVKASGISENGILDFTKKCIVVMCSDNGVVDEGVTQVSNKITAIVAENMANGKATINVLANKCNAYVMVVDIGIASDIDNDKIVNKKFMYGTNNMYKTPSMTTNETIKAIEIGIDIAFDLKSKGYKLIATGEMGIGNTTTSSAITACLLDKKVIEVTGRGAGLSDVALQRKIAVIEKAIKLHKPDKNDPIDVLSKVGGLDIAGLVGVFLGGAAAHVPVLIDGFISAVAALIAIRLCPTAKNYFFATHVSYEPAGKILIEALQIPHILDLNMCLGEGTGAVMAFPIFDLALEVYNKMSSFEDARIESYKPQV